MDIYATNRCETYIKDGEDFQPERWLKETGDTMHPFTSLPFGFGPRMCIGSYSYYYIFISNTVINIVQQKRH